MKISQMGVLNAPKISFAANNTKLSTVVNQLNTQIQKGKRNYDVAEFNSKLNELKESEKKDKAKAPVIDFKDSPMHGSRTAAEWAEMSVTHQRNGLQSLSEVLDYHKQRLATAMREIDRYEKITAGEFSEEELKQIAYNKEFISEEVDWESRMKEQATEFAKRYRDSIITDYTDIINNYRSIYNTFVKEYDNASGGLASSVIGDILKDTTPEGLGLSNLSNNPDEIMEALNSATQKLGDTMKALENAFFNAAGKEMQPTDFKSDRQRWQERIDFEYGIMLAHTIDDYILGKQTFPIDKHI